MSAKKSLSKKSVIAENEHLSTKEVAQILGVSAGTLDVWRCTKRYPQLRHVKFGRMVRYPKTDVLKFLELTSSKPEHVNDSRMEMIDLLLRVPKTVKMLAQSTGAELQKPNAV